VKNWSNQSVLPKPTSITPAAGAPVALSADSADL
jgi:hypothetical protein